MKIAVRTIQIFVGVLFIFSGLVKANDPLGLSYKMEEFFTVWNTDLGNGHFFAKNFLTAIFHFLNEHNLFLSTTMIALEIVAGVALLIGWKKKFVLYLLLALIVFFSFLTGYAFYAKYPNGLPKFTNCGCFGDCLPITPLTSFIKDILLLVMILFLLPGRKYIQPLFSKTFRTIAVGLSLTASLLLQWYVMKYLPLIDCLPMKKGNNIAEQMKPPRNATPSVYETKLVYQNKNTGELKEMSQDEFNNSKIWEDKAWQWKETKTKLVKQGTDTPKLLNFSLTTLNGIDSTEAILNFPGTSVLYFVNPGKSNTAFDKNFWNRKAKELPVFVVTTEPSAFRSDSAGRNYQVFTTDGTVFRIAARVNPTIYILHKGTIVDKRSLARMNSLNLSAR